MPRPTKAKPKRTKATAKPKRARNTTKRTVTRDQFHSLVRKAAQPTKKSKAASK